MPAFVYHLEACFDLAVSGKEAEESGRHSQLTQLALKPDQHWSKSLHGGSAKVESQVDAVPSSGGPRGRQMGITKSLSTGPLDSSTSATSFSYVLGLYRGWRKTCLMLRLCSFSSDWVLRSLPGQEEGM